MCKVVLIGFRVRVFCLLVVEAKPDVCIHIILDQIFCLESKHVTNLVWIRPINESKLEGVLYGTKD